MGLGYLAFILGALDLSTACECSYSLPYCHTDGWCYDDYHLQDYSYSGDCGSSWPASDCSRGKGSAVAWQKVVESCTGSSGKYEASQEVLITGRGGLYYGSCCNQIPGEHAVIATQGWFEQNGCCPQTGISSPCSISNNNGQQSCSPSYCSGECPGCQSPQSPSSSYDGSYSYDGPSSPPPPDTCLRKRAECTQSCTQQGVGVATNTCFLSGGITIEKCACASYSASSSGSVSSASGSSPPDQEVVLVKLQAPGDVSDYGYYKQEGVKTGVATSAFVLLCRPQTARPIQISSSPLASHLFTTLHLPCPAAQPQTFSSPHNLPTLPLFHPQTQVCPPPMSR